MTAPRRTNLYNQWLTHRAELYSGLPAELRRLAQSLDAGPPREQPKAAYETPERTGEPLNLQWETWLAQAAMASTLRDKLSALIAELAIHAPEISDRNAGELLGIDGKAVRSLKIQATDS